MTNSFFSNLQSRARQIDSLLCVGLDPHPSDLPEPTPQAAHDFCLRLMAATADLALAFKPNAAFFEIYGGQGVDALQKVIAAAPPDVPVILDAKRGDIASTAWAYARAAFETLRAGAITVSPYLGYDSIEPFLRDPQRGVFLLCKTSNPGASDLQDLSVTGPGASRTVFETVAHLAQGWNRRDNLGLVVGATHPEALARARLLAPDLWILAPGVGAQGGDLQAALHAGLRLDGLGLLLPVSRSLSRAENPRRAAEQIRDEINKIRQMSSGAGEQGSGGDKNLFTPAPLLLGASRSPAPLNPLADALLDAGCVRFGSFTLKSGLESPIYIDLRRLVGDPRLLAQTAEAYMPILRALAFDRLAALPYAALPIGTAVSLQGGWPMVYPRKEVKEYGTRAEVEGVFHPGERAVVIDDLATTGGSKFEAIERLTAAGLQVSDVVVLIDRQSGAAASLAVSGFRLHAVFTLTQLLDHWQRTGRISPGHIEAARNFLEGE
jgi:uridine monophosphate synthetase